MIQHRVFFLLVPLLLLIGCDSRAIVPIPARLTDAEQWQMVSTFSEPGGAFRFENFLSNEIYFQNVIPLLKSRIKPGGIYMGVGPEQNFTYIVAVQPKIAFITDIRRQNMLELMMYKALFEMAPDRSEFVSLLFSRKRPSGLATGLTADALFDAYRGVVEDPLLFQKNLQSIEDLLLKTHKYPLTGEDLKGIEKVYSVFFDYGPEINYNSGGAGPGGFGGGFSNVSYADLMSANDQQGLSTRTGKNWSFLASEENYLYIRDLELRNLIVPLVGDFSGPKAIRSVGAYAKEHGVVVSTFYLSNVEQYLFMDGVAAKFYRNVETLPLDAASTFIRSGRPLGGGGSDGGFRRRGGYGGPFGLTSMVSPMTDVLKAFDAGRIRGWTDVLSMSK